MARYVRYENSKEDAKQLLKATRSKSTSISESTEAIFEFSVGQVTLHAVMDEFLRTERDTKWLVIYSGQRVGTARGDGKILFTPETIVNIYSYRQVVYLRSGGQGTRISSVSPLERNVHENPKTLHKIEADPLRSQSKKIAQKNKTTKRWMDKLWVPITIMLAFAIVGVVFMQLLAQAQSSLKPQYRSANSASSSTVNSSSGA